MFLSLFCAITACCFFYAVSQQEKIIFSECAQCKIGFFSSFYFYLFNNIAMLSFSLLNITLRFQSGNKSSVLLFKSFRNILVIFGVQMTASLFFFVAQNYYCSFRMQDFLINLFVYQILQFTMQFFICFLYYIKIYKDIEEYLGQKAFVGDNQVVEIFNASFVLNETKSELNEKMRKNRLKPLVMDAKAKANNSNFNITCSTLGESKIVSTVSENSTLNVSKI